MKTLKFSIAILLNLLAYQFAIASATVDPPSSNFGSVVVGSYVDKTFVVKNTEDRDLIFSSPFIDDFYGTGYLWPPGNPSHQFSIHSGGGQFTLHPGETRSIVVRFSPTTTGSWTHTLHLLNNGSGMSGFLYAALNGTGLSPISINVTSPERHLYVLRGTEVTVQYQATFPNPRDAGVALYYDTRNYTSPTEGDGNSSNMTLLKTWTPQVWDAGSPAYLKQSDSFVWNTDVPDETYWLCGILQASGTIQEHDYYDTPITVYSRPPTPILYTLTPNVGSGQTYKLEWNYMVCTEWYELQESESYSMDNPQTYILQGIETLSKELSHANASTGSKNYHYRVRAVNGTYNRQGDWSNILTVTVAVGAAPDIDSNPASYNYGMVPAGTNSDKTFIISNVGTADLVVSGTAITGENVSDFSIQSGGGAFTLAPSATRNLVVRFGPTNAGSKSASVSITSNDPDENPFLINLSGKGSVVPTLLLIDGNKDDFYAQLTGPINGYLQLRYYAWNDNGKPTNDADLSAKIWTAWDEQWLYIYEEVKDNVLSGNATNLWEEDCFELLVDPQATSETNSIWATRLTALGHGTPGVVAADTLNNVPYAQKRWARKIITGGYALEMAIQWSAIAYGAETITPAVGGVFGAAINQHDNDGGAARRATVQWAAVLLNDAYRTPKYLGTVKFLSDHRLQFLARNNISGVTNPVPYNGSDYTRTKVDKTPTDGPGTFSLSQNYPNPFNPSTTIAFNLPAKSFVSLNVFGLDGRQVATLVSEELSAGNHSRQWNAARLPGGVYFYCLQAGSIQETKKLILLK